ncbi:hypothetical protein Esti_005355 [Eimeria stiedai]
MEKEGGPGPDSPLKLLFLRGPQDRAVVYDEVDLPPEPKGAHLPPQLKSDTPGSFARDSLLRRIPNDILARVLQENQVYLHLHPRTEQLLLQLQDEMRNADTTEVRPLECFGGPSEGTLSEKGSTEDPRAERWGAPERSCARKGGPQGDPLSPCGFCRECEERDVRMWNEVLLKEALKEKRVLSKIPWILAEVYCYRRVLHAFDFYSTLHDPFYHQKMAGLEAAAAAAEVYGQQVEELLSAVAAETQRHSKPSLEKLKRHIRSAVFASLEGNAGDLSLWPKGPAAAAAETQRQQPGAACSNWDEDPPWLLAADFEAFFADFCSSKSSSRLVHIWTDNAGEELLADLLLSTCLLLTTAAQQVRLCVKQQPTYVSDATKADDSRLRSWVSLLRGWEREGRLIVSASFFCCSPLELRRLPKDVEKSWRQEAALVVLKGDMNYRRLLAFAAFAAVAAAAGDRAWPTDTPFAKVASYCCTRILALRLLKAELGCGMAKETTLAAAAADPKWMVDGKWGVMQYYSPFSSPLS